MYLYIYDSFLNNKNYEPILYRIEARLFDLGISGQIEKLTVLRSLTEIIQEGIKRGVKNVIIVGNDQSVSKVVNVIVQKNQVTLGIIPLGEPNKIAAYFGIPKEEKACDILSARIMEKIDLGKINNQYFLSLAELSKVSKVTLECEGKYTVIPQGRVNDIKIFNFGWLLNQKKSSPKDGILEATVIPQKTTRPLALFKKDKQESIFPIKKIKIKSKETLPVIIDQERIVKTPANIEIVPQKIKIIVGKKRKI